MKKTYFLFISIFLTGFAFGQVTISHDYYPGVVQNGLVVNEALDTYGHNVYMHCTNDSGVSKNYKFRRVIVSSSTSFTDQFCDDNLCYSCSGPDWTSPSPMTVAAGDSTIMKPVLNFLDGGTALIRYYVLDNGNGDAIIDSVDLNVSSSVGYEEIDISMSAYPNPAAEDFYIDFAGNEGMNFQVVVYNVLGAEVMHKTIVNGVNKLNVENLNNGVYFYSITSNSDIIETKKLVVRH